MRIENLVTLLTLATALPASAGELTGSAPSVRLDPSVSFDLRSGAENSESVVTPAGERYQVRLPRSGPTESYNDSVCATMRTYVVARSRRDSDSTRIVGYARCQPAWKFQLRTAEQGVEDSR